MPRVSVSAQLTVYTASNTSLDMHSSCGKLGVRGSMASVNPHQVLTLSLTCFLTIHKLLSILCIWHKNVSVTKNPSNDVEPRKLVLEAVKPLCQKMICDVETMLIKNCRDIELSQLAKLQMDLS
jgi:hypothetical protein